MLQISRILIVGSKGMSFTKLILYKFTLWLIMKTSLTLDIIISYFVSFVGKEILVLISIFKILIKSSIIFIANHLNVVFYKLPAYVFSHSFP